MGNPGLSSMLLPGAGEIFQPPQEHYQPDQFSNVVVQDTQHAASIEVRNHKPEMSFTSPLVSAT